MKQRNQFGDRPVPPEVEARMDASEVQAAYIYALCDPETGKPRYVGQTSSPYTRYGSHLNDKKDGPKRRWIEELHENGLKPVMRVLEAVEWSQVDARQQHWIKELKASGEQLVNVTSPGKAGVQRKRRPVKKPTFIDVLWDENDDLKQELSKTREDLERVKAECVERIKRLEDANAKERDELLRRAVNAELELKLYLEGKLQPK